MTQEQFDDLMEQNKNIEWFIDEPGTPDRHARFKNVNLPYYQEGGETSYVMEEFKKMTPDQLIRGINTGYDVEGITRITGYMGLTRNFNKGKQQELKDRVKGQEI